jgi:mannose-6-phosphate isomerase
MPPPALTHRPRYTSREPSHWALSNKPFARSGSEQTTAFSPPLEEFDVLRTELRGARETLAPARGPTIGIVTGGGSARFSAGGEEVVLPEGGVVYVVPGVEVAVELAGGAGEGEVWWATSSI